MIILLYRLRSVFVVRMRVNIYTDIKFQVLSKKSFFRIRFFASNDKKVYAIEKKRYLKNDLKIVSALPPSSAVLWLTWLPPT